jgi:hypothetical protein
MLSMTRPPLPEPRRGSGEIATRNDVWAGGGVSLDRRTPASRVGRGPPERRQGWE